MLAILEFCIPNFSSIYRNNIKISLTTRVEETFNRWRKGFENPFQNGFILQKCYIHLSLLEIKGTFVITKTRDLSTFC